MDSGGITGGPVPGEGCSVRMPVACYPPGGLKDLEKAAEGVLEVPAREAALVLVDTWNGGDPEEGQDPPQHLRSTRLFLHRCREYGVTVIHAPNHPVVDKYPQYCAIRETVREFLQDYPPVSEIPPFLDWPPRENGIQTKARQLRNDALVTPPEIARETLKQRDISRFLKPLEDEFVVASHNEFRYVLWKRKVKLLLYVGGALNECMQHRDTGINFLAGTDSGRTAFTIVVLEDCSTSKRTPRFDSATISKAMLDYFMCKITFVADSGGVEFIPLSETGGASQSTS